VRGRRSTAGAVCVTSVHAGAGDRHTRPAHFAHTFAHTFAPPPAPKGTGEKPDLPRAGPVETWSILTTFGLTTFGLTTSGGEVRVAWWAVERRGDYTRPARSAKAAAAVREANPRLA
jgi:hypothetical protein